MHKVIEKAVEKATRAIEAKEAMQATQEVLKTHCISQDRSEDLLR